MVLGTPARRPAFVAVLATLALAVVLGPLGLFLGGGVLIATGVAIRERKLMIAGAVLAVLTLAFTVAYGIPGGEIGGGASYGAPPPERVTAP